MSYTKGPWSYKPRIIANFCPQTGEPKSMIDHWVGTETKSIALVPVMDDEETLANARLIAAAPEMLDALIEIMSMLECGELVRDITSDGNPDFAMKMLDFIPRLHKIQLAIAKATGGEK